VLGASQACVWTISRDHSITVSMNAARPPAALKGHTITVRVVAVFGSKGSRNLTVF